MTLEQILARIAAINTEMETASGEALAALNTELDGLVAERNRILGEARTRQAMRSSIAASGAPVVERSAAPAAAAPETFTAASDEYRSAFLHHLRGDDMSDVERRAFTYLTTNTTAPLPTQMLNQIINLIGEAHPIVADVYTMNSGTAISIPTATTVVADAGTSTEGGASNELEITFGSVDLSGNDYTANVKLTYKMANMAIPAFEAYLVSQISDRLGAKLAADIVSNIKSGMAAANAIATGVTYANICAGFGALKRVGKVNVYCTRAGAYNNLAALVGTDGHPIFQQPVTAGMHGVLLGAEIKFEDALGDNELLIGDPKKYIQNVVAPIVIESDKDLDTHKLVYSGYTCQEGALSDDKAFALVS